MSIKTKLYTEEQIKIAIEIADESPDLLGYDEIISKLTFIELPSYEEVAKKLKETLGNNGEPEHQQLVCAGALWMLEQIKQQAECGTQE